MTGISVKERQPSHGKRNDGTGNDGRQAGSGRNPGQWVKGIAAVKVEFVEPSGSPTVVERREVRLGQEPQPPVAKPP